MEFLITARLLRSSLHTIFIFKSIFPFYTSYRSLQSIYMYINLSDKIFNFHIDYQSFDDIRPFWTITI